MRSDCLIIITSFEREKMLNDLLQNLKGQVRKKDIIIYDDCSKFPYPKNYNFIRFEKHLGKEYLWAKYEYIFNDIDKSYKYFIHIGDDIIVKKDFVEKSIAAWENINDEKKICLSLMNDKRVLVPQWTGTLPIVNCTTILTQWNDLCFVCEKRFFENIKIKPVPLSRFLIKGISSGVGDQISRQLFAKGFNQYHVKETLVHHGNHDSKMHDEHRKQTPIIC